MPATGIDPYSRGWGNPPALRPGEKVQVVAVGVEHEAWDSLAPHHCPDQVSEDLKGPSGAEAL